MNISVAQQNRFVRRNYRSYPAVCINTILFNSTLLEKLVKMVGLGYYQIYDGIFKFFEGKVAKTGWVKIVKYIGMALALTSFLWTYISPALQSNYVAKCIGVALSALGVVFFLIEKLILNKYEEEVEGHLFPIVSIIEWIIPFGGLADAVYNLSQGGD